MTALDTQFQYVNLSSHYDSTQNYHRTELDFNSTESLLPHNENSLVSVERFLLRKVRLPLFEVPTRPWAVRGTSLSGTELDLTSFGGGIVDSDGFGYSYYDFVIALRNALLAEDVITASDHLVLDTQGRIYFELTGTASVVEFNSQLVTDLNIFHYNDFVQPTQEWYQLTVQPDLQTGGGNDAFQSFGSVTDLFPVDSIIFRSDSLPIEREKLNVGSGATSRTIASITDFQLTQPESLSCINTVSFITNMRRYHSLAGEIGDNFDIFVEFQSVNGKRRVLETASGGSSSIKLLLETRVQLAE